MMNLKLQMLYKDVVFVEFTYFYPNISHYNDIGNIIGNLWRSIFNILRQHRNTSDGLLGIPFVGYQHLTNAFGGMGTLAIVWAIVMTIWPSLRTMKTVTACLQALRSRDYGISDSIV